MPPEDRRPDAAAPGQPPVTPAPAAPAAPAAKAAKAAPARPVYAVGPSPHLHAPETVPAVMRWVVIALLPAVAVSVWFFGASAVRVMALSTLFCAGVEWACLRLMKTPGSLRDWSAVVTGLLLGMNLPPTSPWWLILTGSIVAMLVAKHLFGGLGGNIFNPALTARVFLLVSWPTYMTTWLKPGVRGWIAPGSDLAAITEATPLGLLKEGRLGEISTSAADLLFGNMGGSVGEISTLALLLGGLLLLWRKVITWDIPVSFIGSTALITGAAWLLGDHAAYAPPHLHVLAGGLFLGAFFMATDMVTSPITFRGRLVFGAGCGVMTAVIRLWGGYPEGVSFAILLMNALTPMIDHYLRPQTFGTATARAKAAAKAEVAR